MKRQIKNFKENVAHLYKLKGRYCPGVKEKGERFEMTLRPKTTIRAPRYNIDHEARAETPFVQGADQAYPGRIVWVWVKINQPRQIAAQCQESSASLIRAGSPATTLASNRLNTAMHATSLD